MLVADDKVAAPSAGRRLAVNGVRSHVAPETRAMFLSIDAVSPVADSEREAGLNQNIREATKILLHPPPAKTRTLGYDVATAAPAERWRAEHLLPRRDGLLENVLFDVLM